VTKPPTNQLLQESIHILRFGVTGLAGFLVDAGVLALMVHWIGADPFTGRTVSAPIAILFTFVSVSSPIVALAIASAAAMFVNYLGARFLAFRGAD
jgi:putative flippase GtrA